MIAIHDPKYDAPLLLATNLEADAKVVWFLYKDRWAIEQVPLAGKKMLGGSASFVHSKESLHRLPGLVLLVGNIFSLIAAGEHIRVRMERRSRQVIGTCNVSRQSDASRGLFPS